MLRFALGPRWFVLHLRGFLDTNIRFDGSCTMGAAIVPQLRLLGDKLDPSSSDKQPKTHYLIVTFLGQSYLDS